MTASAKPRLQDLPDVPTLGNGQVLVYNATTHLFEAQDPESGVEADIQAHSDDTTFVHGIINTAALATDSDISSAVADHDADTSVHGIADTSALATDAELAAHAADATSVHGIADTSDLILEGDARLTNSRAPTSHTHAESEVTNLVTDLAGKQPLDSDLTAIAALSTTSFGRSLLALADAAAGRTALSAAAATHTHAQADVTSLTSDLAGKQASSEKGQNSGYASLDSGGKVPTGQIPALSLVNVQTAASQVAQLALTAQAGDVVVRTDEQKTYMHNGGTAGTMADYTFLQTPASAVLSVNGQTGAVSLVYSDVGAASTSDTRLSDSRAPTGAAGGVLGGTYPNPSFAADMATQAELNAHESDTSSVHGITDTTVLATDAEVATAVSDHSSDTTSVHGIADTTVLATDSEVATAVSDHSTDTTSVHGIADTTVLATDAEVAAAVSAHESDTTVHGVDTANVPSSGQKAALAGTSGTPSGSNLYATKATTDALATSVAAKQDSSTAATDAELTAHEADTTSVHGIADTSVLATDSDVALKENVGEIHGLPVPVPDAGDDGRAIVYDDGTGEWVLAADPAGYTDEQAQDAVGTILADSATLDFTYTDATPAITAAVKAASIDESHLTSGASIPQAKVANLTSDLAAKADASTVATDAELSAHSSDTTAVHGIADTADVVLTGDSRLSDSRAPNGAAGGVLSGTYPNPGFAADMATQAELDAVAAAKQPLDSDLTAIAALTTTSYGRALLALADAAAGRTALGAQAQDTDLDAIAALTSAADKGIYATGAGTWATFDLSSFARTFLDDADAATVRATIGAQQSDATLTALAGLATGADKLAYSSGTDTFAQTDLTAAGRALLDDADAQAQRTTLDIIGVGTKQAADGATYAFASANFPTAGQKNALAGTSGTPGSGNTYVTDADVRNTNSRGLAGYVPIQTTPIGFRVAGSAALTKSSIKPDGTFTTIATTTMTPIHLFAADLNVTGKTTRLVVRLQVSTNGTAPAVNFTAGLSLIGAASGGADALTWATNGNHISGSTVTINTPAANSNVYGVGSAFDLPADGAYFLTLTTSGALAATNPRFGAAMTLLMTHV